MDQDQQQKYLQLQIMSQQIKMTQQQLGTLEKQEQQLLQTLDSLDQFGKSEIGSETYVSVATGIFAKAELKDNKNLLVNVGANTVVEKDVESTQELLKQQIDEIKKVYMQLSEDLQKLGMEAHKLEHEIQGTTCNH